MKKSDKKILTIIGIIVATIVLVIGGGLVFITATDTGQEIQHRAQIEFGEVEIPTDTRELTEVPKPKENKPDKPEDKHVGVDMQGRRVERTQDNGYEKKIKQVSNIGKEFSIPAVGLYTPLGTVVSHNGEIEPTSYTSTFVVKDYSKGWPNPSKGSIILAAHTLDEEQIGDTGFSPEGIGPGNMVFEPGTRDSRLNIGDEINIGKLKYEVTDQKRLGKGLVSYDKEIWNDKPGTMHLILCFPNSNDNFVITGKFKG